MRLLVISDTHKKIGSVIELLSGNHSFDRVIHLGDHVRDAEDIEAVCGITVERISGNCDWGCSSEPYHRVLDVAGKSFYLCHGHREQVKYGDSVLRQLIRREGYDGALYGHTHCAVVAWEGDSLIMNPGSISQPRDGAPSYGVIHIDDKGLIHTNIVRIKG